MTHFFAGVEDAVLKEIDSLGYAHKPHIVNGLRCAPRAPYPHLEARQSNLLWRLWDTKRFRNFCLEATYPVDRARSIQMPYCLASAQWPQQPYQSDRGTRVLFIGTPLPNRRETLRALNNTPGGRLVILKNRRETGSLMQEQIIEQMRNATYTLCPPGDTPESRRVYHALAAGSIPLLDPGFQPPPVVNWSAISAPIAIQVHRLRSVHRLRGRRRKKATIRLPKNELDLQREAWKHARAFECSASNPYFAQYVKSSLAHLIRCAEDEAAGVRCSEG